MPPARGSGHEFTAVDTDTRRPVGPLGPGRYWHTVPLRGTTLLIR
jgi:hypothetical protein